MPLESVNRSFARKERIQQTLKTWLAATYMSIAQQFSASMANEPNARSNSSRLRNASSKNRRSHEVLNEFEFRRIFCWERKRAERSGRPFLLMLMTGETLLQANHGGRTLAEIVAALAASMRDTDIAGWYRERAMLGTIFLDILKVGNRAPESVIGARVTSALRECLTPEQMDQLQLSFRMFPEDRKPTSPRQQMGEQLYPDLVERDEARRLPLFIKRTVDVVGSVALLLICSPLLAAIALAIKLTSKGPVLFKQERVGRFGVPFTFLKFRSMKCVNDPSTHREYVRQLIAGKFDSTQPDANQACVYKIQNDPRVTRVGRILRKTSLDELPQLLNVLKGEMSLVGPRPPIPYEFEVYKPWHRQRLLEAKPGITGLWQVNGRSRVCFDDMVRLDLQYARTWSLWSDIKILLQTPRAVLRCEGAY